MTEHGAFARRDVLESLKNDTFDVLVVGGGATGAGTALDAATRGLKVGLVEADDFSAGTSSRSTKLIHGGVRYLEKAVKEFDRSQFNLVRDALKERAVLLQIAPHLAHPIALLTPLYSSLQVPYFLTGLKIYDWLAGRQNLAPSRYVSRSEALERFPMLKKESLRGGVLYYDGQFDDARMNVSLALTAAEQGATVANHLEVVGLLKDRGRLCGASLRDTLSGELWETKARVIVNATGPFVDTIRLLDDPGVKPMLSASSGAHIVLDARFSPPETGLLIPETEDGRVLFLLPWLGYTLVGTTDNPAVIAAHPKATQEEVAYILRHVQEYFDLPVKTSDVLTTFSGLRPLVSDPEASDTASLSRDHVVNVSDSGLITIAGGKWTTYRKMALDTVDEVVKLGGLKTGSSKTETLKLVGGAGFNPAGAKGLQRDFELNEASAEHLNRAYGDRARKVLESAEPGLLRPLIEGHPYLAAEVLYATRFEAACTVMDVLARRLRLGFLDREATLAVLPEVTALMAEELDWADAEKENQLERAKDYFSSEVAAVTRA